MCVRTNVAGCAIKICAPPIFRRSYVEHVVPLHGRARKLLPIRILLSCSHSQPHPFSCSDDGSDGKRRMKKWSAYKRYAFVCLYRCVQIHALLTTHQHPMTTVNNCDAIDFCVHTAFATTTTTKVREGDLIPRFQCDHVYFISFITNPMKSFISRFVEFVFLLAAYVFFSHLLRCCCFCMIYFSPNWWVGNLYFLSTFFLFWRSLILN